MTWTLPQRTCSSDGPRQWRTELPLDATSFHFLMSYLSPDIGDQHLLLCCLLEEVLDCDEDITLQPSLLHSEQTKWPQLLLVTLALEAFYHLFSHLWRYSNSVMSFLYWGTQNCTQHSGWGIYWQRKVSLILHVIETVAPLLCFSYLLVTPFFTSSQLASHSFLSYSWKKLAILYRGSAPLTPVQRILVPLLVV